jgi:hypothetical protein
MLVEGASGWATNISYFHLKGQCSESWSKGEHWGRRIPRYLDMSADSSAPKSESSCSHFSHPQGHRLGWSKDSIQYQAGPISCWRWSAWWASSPSKWFYHAGEWILTNPLLPQRSGFPTIGQHLTRAVHRQYQASKASKLVRRNRNLLQILRANRRLLEPINGDWKRRWATVLLQRADSMRSISQNTIKLPQSEALSI